MGIPFAGYSSFSDCVSKNKGKRDPNAYCGYIKNQIEGGKKKEEEYMESPEHEAFHLQEEISKMEAGGAYADFCDYHRKSWSSHTPQESRQDADVHSEEAGSKSRLPYECPHCHLGFPSYEKLDSHIGIDHPEKYGKKEARDYVCPSCGSRNTAEYEKSGMATCKDCSKVFDISSDFNKSEAPSKMHQHAPRADTRERHMAQTLGYSGKEFPEIEGAPESELERASVEFLKTLSATIDTVKLMAKDSGYMGVSEKTSPTPPTYMYEVSQGMADVVMKESKGFGVEVNWFNATMDELRDIVNSADKFFVDAGWNSKETVKEYKKHMKSQDKDRM